MQIRVVGSVEAAGPFGGFSAILISCDRFSVDLDRLAMVLTGRPLVAVMGPSLSRYWVFCERGKRKTKTLVAQTESRIEILFTG